MNIFKKEPIFDKLYNSLGNQKEFLAITDTQCHQISKYPEKIDPKTKNPMHNYVIKLLEDNEKEKLYAGIKEYQEQHAQKIEDFIKNHKNPSNFNLKEAKNNTHFFREQLANYCQKIRNSKDGFISKKKKKFYKTSPQKATTTMNDLLGSQGTFLAKLALEEEANSKEYMDKVFNDSIHVYPGPKWKNPILAFIGGPSSSGKTTAIKSTFTQVSQTVGKNSADLSENYQTDIDGALSRGHFVQSLLKQVAETKGFCGISDLYYHCALLKKIKIKLYETAFSSKNLSVCIPETFSDIWQHSELLWFMDTLAQPNRQLAFARVACNKETVRKLGVTRAYTSSPQEQHESGELDMHGRTSYESKKYYPRGFILGNLGSKIAASLYSSINETPSIVLHNDLLIKKEDPKRPGLWIEAQCDDKETIIVSQRIYNDWIKNKPIHSNDNPVTLPEYINSHKKLSLEIKQPTNIPIIELIAFLMLHRALNLNKERINKIIDKLNGQVNAEEKQILNAKLEMYYHLTTLISKGINNSIQTIQTLIPTCSHLINYRSNELSGEVFNTRKNLNLIKKLVEIENPEEPALHKKSAKYNWEIARKSQSFFSILKNLNMPEIRNSSTKDFNPS